MEQFLNSSLIADIGALSTHIQDGKTLIALVVIAAIYKLINRFIMAKLNVKSNTIGQAVSSGLDMIPAVPIVKNVVGLFQKLLK